MITAEDLALLRRDELEELFDIRSTHNASTSGGFQEDPYPTWHRLRETGPVHEGVVHELTGCDEPVTYFGLPYPDRPHFSAFSFEACDEAFRDTETFASSPGEGFGENPSFVERSLICMDGTQHRRYRALVQPSLVPARATWWLDRWISDIVDAVLDRLGDTYRADLNLELCAQIPILTITGSFGVGVSQALEMRRALHDQTGDHFERILEPVLAARHAQLQDDLMSRLVEAEVTDDDGTTHRLSDDEVYSFAYLLLIAGSGTTWKQMGIALTALLTHPHLLDAVREDRTLLHAAIEESMRWAPNVPMFSRFVRRDIDFHGVPVSQGSVIHLCIGAANRDPARYQRPDEYDPYRPIVPHLAFGGGPHVCIGMHVARAEMFAAINGLLDRFPNLRLDPDAQPPRIIGMYHRGPTEIHVRVD